MNKIRILIVEDEPVIGMDLQNILTSLRYDVPAVVTSGEEAIEKAEELKPDLILMDIVLSGDMDGIDATKSIREKLKIPVIYLTAHTEEFTFKRARETDPYGYLVKPVGKSDLYTAVETAIRRHELESRLQDSENRYRTLVMNSNEAILVAQDGFIKFANPKLTEISGYLHEELRSMPFSEFIHPEDQAMVFERHLSRLKGEKLDQVYSFRTIDKSGSIKWLEINATLFEWEGRPATLNFLSDITARKHAEEALRESEERFRMLTEQNLMGITLLQDNRIKYANQAAADINEYSVEEIINWEPTEFHKSIHPDDLPFVIEQGQKKQMGDDKGIVLHYPYRIITKSGKVKWVDQYSRTVFYEGRPADLITRIDITDRMRFEEALQESEKKYRELVENINEIIYSIDENGIINYLSPVAEILYGYKVSDLIGRRFTDFIHEEDRERITKGFKRSLQDMHQAAEYRVVTETGETRWFRVSERKLYEGKAVKGIQGIITDITENMRAEDALRESEERYRLIAENVSDVIWTTDLDLHVTYVSPSVKKVRGYSLEEAMAQKPEDMLPPASLEAAFAALAEELAIEEQENKDLNRSRTLELELKCKDGSTIWSEMRLTFIRNQEGRAIGILGAARDITDRRSMEDALRESEKKYRLLANNVTDVIWTLDINSMRFTYVSPSNMRVTGFTQEEAMSRTVKDSLTPSSLETAMKILEEEISRDKDENADPNRSRVLEMEQYHRDGHTVWTEIRVRFLRDRDGNPIEVLGISRDITDRKQAEERIKASLKEKEILLKEIHHRVKNNFQIISSLLNLHERKIIDEELTEHFRDFHNRIRSMALVHERLYQSEDLALIGFAEYINIMAQELFQTLQCDPDRIKLQIKAQDVQLGIDRAIPCGLVLNELLTNAMKHAFPPGLKRKGTIKIILDQRVDNAIQLIIGDNGVGISKNIDVNRAETLGLKLMKNLITNQLNGEFKLNQKKGTEYTITFPGK